MTSAVLEAPATEALVAAASVRRIVLGGRTALFCERRQQLFELNETADHIWCALSSGTAPDLPAGYVAAAVGDWLDAGLMLPASVAARASGRAGVELPLRIGGISATVAAHGAAPELEAVFGQFRSAPAASGLRLSLVEADGAWFLLKDGAPLGRFAAERIVPEVKAVLTDALAQATGGGAFLLHAALLARGGRGLLITGAPGAGKTTLTVALAARGFGYGADDIVRVSPRGALSGVPFSPAVKAGAWALAEPYAPEIAGLPVHLRSDRQSVRYLPVGRFADGAVDGLGWVLVLDRRAGVAAQLEPVEPMAMLAELLGGAFSADRGARGETLAAFSAQLAGAACRRLIYSDLAQAVVAIEDLVR